MSEGGDPWFHSAPCGLLSTSLEGIVLEANATFLQWTGYPQSAVVGRRFDSMLTAGSQLFYETRHVPVVHLEGRAREVALTLERADGSTMPLLVNSVRDDEAMVIRTALFNASERIQYETELLGALKAAESSEARVRILQDVSRTFGVSASDEDVDQSFVDVAREAFVAREAAVLLADDDGVMSVVAGVNPLAGMLRPVDSLRATTRVTVVDLERAQREFPELAAAMREKRVASLSITPLIADGRRLGILVCFFGRRDEFDDRFFDLQRALGRQASQTLVRVRLQRRLAHLALHDQLTGVANRQLLQESLDQAIERAAQATGEPLAVLFLDVDGFKEINDQFDHASGDLVLIELATRLTDGVRAGDVVGRIGGDEFVAVCANADADAAAAIAHRILATAQTPIAVSAGIVSASVSVGVVVYRPDRDERPSAESLLNRADRAMYESKDAGKNRMTMDAALGG